MMKKLKIVALLLAAALVLGFAGCGDGTNDLGETGDPTLSFESFSPPSIYVENPSNQKLVAFKGSLNPNNLISGIPAYATNHGLAKKASLFSSTGDFALVVITEAEYNSKKDNIGSAEVYAEIYAFYNHEATNGNVFTISASPGGTGRITLNNPTDWNVEIHKDGPTGLVIGYAASQLTNTVLRVDAPSDLSLYPVFKKYNSLQKEIWTIFPKYTSGALIGLPYAKEFALEHANSTTTWQLSEVTNYFTTTSMTTGSFYLRITNNSNTSVRFRRGDDDQFTSMGILGIPPGNTNTYFVSIAKNADGTYPASEVFSQLKIGTPQSMYDIPPYTFKLDYTYTINVTGADISNLVIGTIQESDAPIDVNKLISGN